MTLNQTVPSSDEELTADEVAFIADHMAACAAYLEHIDSLWIGDPQNEEANEALISETLEQLEIDIPDMPPELGLKLQRRVNSSIQRGNLAASALKLGTQGIMEVLLAMIRPILATNKQKDS